MKGKYEVISGERRLKAARIAGLEKVPCIIIQDRNVAQEVSIIENIHREDLHPIELGNAFKFLLDKNYFKSQNSIARNLAINESTVSECIKYTKIPEVVKSYLIKQNIKSRDKLRKILKFKNNHDEINNYLGINNIKIINKNFSVMRINLYNKKLKFQLNGINRLPNEQKIILQNKLKEIVKEIDEIESFK
jgi:ParB family chromosome partitioning protein